MDNQENINELIKTVSEDLEFVKNEWNMDDISDSNLRRSSHILRRLLIEGDLNKVSIFLNFGKIKIYSKDDSCNEDGLVLSQNGGGKFNGMTVSNLKIYNKIHTPDQIKKDYESDKNKKAQAISINRFLKNKCITFQDMSLDREDIIKYVANKLGGVHYDSSRVESSGKPNKEELMERYKVLDNYRKEGFQIAGKDAVYFELLSVGKTIIKSNDILKLRKKMNTYLSALEGSM